MSVRPRALLIAALVLGCSLGFAADEAKKKQKDPDKGFRSIFNGQDLSGWEGDTSLWSVKDGMIVGKTTDESPVEANTFLIWREGQVRDFQLRLKMRVIGDNNSGVQYRSAHRPDQGPFVIAGYQCDIHPEYSGMLYDEKGRGIVAGAGQKVVVMPDGRKLLRGTIKQPKEGIDPTQWNELTIVARGNRLVHKINGKRTIEVYDFQEAEREMEGLVALQLHRGPAMEVQVKDIELKELKPRDPTPVEEIEIPEEAEEVGGRVGGARNRDGRQRRRSR